MLVDAELDTTKTLLQQTRHVLKQVNGQFLTQAADRADRFMNLGIRDDSGVKYTDGDFITHDDNIAVLYEIEGKLEIWYGVVQKTGCRSHVTKKGKPKYKNAENVHVNDHSGIIVAQWYKPHRTKTKIHRRIQNNLCWDLPLQSKYKLEKITMEPVVGTCIIKYNVKENCYLLDKEDEDYMKDYLKRYLDIQKQNKKKKAGEKLLECPKDNRSHRRSKLLHLSF